VVGGGLTPVESGANEPEREGDAESSFAGPLPVFLNPKSGTAANVRDALAGESRVTLRECDPATLKESALDAIRSGVRRLIVSGGDGSVAAVAAAIVEHSGEDGGRPPVEMAVIPGGTFNHFARDHGVPLEVHEAVSVALGSTTTAAHAATVNGHVFLNTSSVGAYVRFVSWREKLEPRLGYFLASLIAGIRTVLWQRPFYVEVEVDGQARRYRSTLVFIGVGERETKLPTLGKRVEGGRSGLHVMVVRGAARGRLVALGLAAAARGLARMSESAHLDVFMVDRCTIQMRRPRGRVAVDGELVMMQAPLTYEVRRDALTITVPAGYHS
jgi:diacylglycerol kinase family enzyme